MIVILFGYICVQKIRTNSFQEVLSGPVWGLEYTSNSSRLAPLWETNYGEHDVHFICGKEIVQIDVYIEQCVRIGIFILGRSWKILSKSVVPHEWVG